MEPFKSVPSLQTPLSPPSPTDPATCGGKVCSTVDRNEIPGVGFFGRIELCRGVLWREMEGTWSRTQDVHAERIIGNLGPSCTHH